jgi:hypothetical protein
MIGTSERERALRFTRMLEPYWGADTRRSVVQLLTSAVPFVLLWTAMLWSLDVGYWLTLLLALPTSGFVMRLFMIQHDCGHGSFFRSRSARDWTGSAIGVLTLVPYQYWRKTHAYHHAHSGDLDFRGLGDISTWTPLWVCRREQDAHVPALGVPEQRRPLGTDRVHHRTEVVHPLFEHRHLVERHRVGQPGSTLVEEDQSGEARQPAKESGH